MSRTKTAVTLEEKLVAVFVPAEEQPYSVPENWRWVRLGSISEIIMGQSPAGNTVVEHAENEGCIPLIGGAADIAGSKLSASRYTTNPTRLAKAGDIIICVRATIGNPVISDGVYCLGRGVGAIRAIEANSSYLYWLIKHAEPYLMKNSTGSTYSQINGSILNAMPCPLPPLAEQERIVERVELLFAKLDKAANVLNNLICNSDERRAAILRDAFDGSLTARWRREHQVSRAEWIENTIGNCCKVGSGGTPSRKNPSNYVGDIPWVKTGEIDWNHIRETEEHISQKAVETSSAKLYQPGAVLVAMYGMGQTRGKAALLDIAATTNQAVCVLEPDSSLDREFLFRFFQRNYWAVRELSFGGNQLNLSATVIKGLKISLPPLEEQQEIARTLTRLLEVEQATVSHARNALERIQEVKASILARALRGELGTNDPNDVGVFESHHEQ